MTLENAIKKIKKAGLGLKIEGSKVIAFGKSKKIEFFENYDGSISSPYVLGFFQRDDSMTDYFAGTFYDNLTQAIRSATR